MLCSMYYVSLLSPREVSSSLGAAGEVILSVAVSTDFIVVKKSFEWVLDQSVRDMWQIKVGQQMDGFTSSWRS